MTECLWAPDHNTHIWFFPTTKLEVCNCIRMRLYTVSLQFPFAGQEVQTFSSMTVRSIKKFFGLPRSNWKK